MPGGFHPFHAGHAALYHSAVKAFPNADVYVAATNDTKTRPFPFTIKEKLAKLAGVAPGKFIQVKSPFQPKEITDHFDPEEDVVIFVRSEKDKNESPKPGGTKKDGSPAYFQPWTGKDIQPFSKHAYMAYLPTVEFGPGIKSATEIRNAWPKLDDRRKTAMVMSLYPETQKNPKLASNVVKMLDMGMGNELVEEDISRRGFLRGLGAAAVAGAAGSAMAQSRPVDVSKEFQNMRQDDPRIQHNKDIEEMARAIYEQIVDTRGQPIDRRQQQMWMTIAREKATEKLSKYAPGRPAQQSKSSGFPAQGSERRVSRNIDNFESQGVEEAKRKKKSSKSLRGYFFPGYAYYGGSESSEGGGDGGGGESVEEGSEEALQYATQAHAGQTRSGGDPYITHPMRVADHIKQYKKSHNLDALISAAYLHDTVEDTDTTHEALHDLFGGLVASLVKELTSDPEEIKKVGKAQYLAHKMAAMSSYALVIKLADRLDNVKDITTARTPEWRQKYKNETEHILNYIEKTRALSGTHQKLIELIRAKLSELDNSQKELDEGPYGQRQESDDPWGDQGRFAGDTVVNIGGESPRPKLIVGDMVRVNAGHYKGIGEIAEIKGDRAKVWMDNYGRSFVFDMSDLIKYIPESIDYLEEK